MFFSEIDIDFATYADDTTSYNSDLLMEKVIETQEKNAEELLQWFCNNFHKANSKKFKQF